jgi:flagellar motor protein MotB
MKRFLSLMVALVFALTCFGTVMAAEKAVPAAAPAKAAPADNTMKKEGEAAKPEKKKATKKKATKKKAKKAEEKKAEEPKPEALMTLLPAPSAEEVRPVQKSSEPPGQGI